MAINKCQRGIAFCALLNNALVSASVALAMTCFMEWHSVRIETLGAVVFVYVGYCCYDNNALQSCSVPWGALSMQYQNQCEESCHCYDSGVLYSGGKQRNRSIDELSWQY